MQGRDGPSGFFWVVSMNEEVIKQFCRLAYWSLSMACYVCSSGKPFRTAPIGVNDSFLSVPGHSSISCSVSCQHASQTTLPSNGSHLSCPLDDDLLEDRVNFFFLFISSSASSGVLEASQGFNKCLLHWINWGCIVRSSLSRLVFNGIPTEWRSEACAWWFSRFVSCPVAMCTPARVVREYCAPGDSYHRGSRYSF